MKRKRLLAGVLSAVLILIALFLAQGVRQYAPPSFEGRITPGLGFYSLRGVVHIHSRYSDGSGTIKEIAAAAERSGLDFVVTSDHNTLLPLREGKEGFYGGVCVMIGSEISVGTGHYLALNVPQMAARLGGPPDVVIRDVNRLGGFGIIAHPYEPGYAPWTDWRADGFSGMEIVNGHSMFKRAGIGTLLRALTCYPLNPTYTYLKFLEAPVENLRKWDSLCAVRPVSGTYGADAHANIEVGEKFGLKIPSYESVFRFASLNVWLRGDGRSARSEFNILKENILGALRKGSCYISFDGMGRDSGFIFYARQGKETFLPGEAMTSISPDLTFHADLEGPEGTVIKLIRDGKTVSRSDDGTLTYRPESEGAYRVEVFLPPGFSPARDDMPWIISNPLYIGGRYGETMADMENGDIEAAACLPVEDFEDGLSDFRAASADGSEAVLRVVPGDESGETRQVGRYQFRLGRMDPKTRYTWCTLNARTAHPYHRYAGVTFRARSDKIIRLGVRIKEIAPSDEGITNWDHPVLIDDQWRCYVVPFSSMSRYSTEKRQWVKAEEEDMRHGAVLTFLLDNRLNWGGTEGEILFDDIALYP